MDRQTFFQNLRDSRLLDDEQIADIESRAGDSALQALAASLVDDGTLTSFQLKQLWSGQTKGLVLGQYRILEELGRGGYGCVYKARHNLMERVVALKVITPDLVEDDRARAWFRREVLAATHLNHPNIVLAYDADEVDGTLFFAMEFIDGDNLDNLVRKQGALPIGMACELMHQAAKALQYAHEKGMVHRDIKPANLLIPRAALAELHETAPHAFANGTRPVLVKVVDFGLARLQGKATSSTLVLQSDKGFVGTPDYVSPEQARNVHDVDIRSDLYSLGCTFYYALTGRRPFKAGGILEIIVQHLEKEPEPLEKYRPEIPPSLASIVRRLMAKKPEKRFQTPNELLGELGFFFGREGSRPNIALPPIAPSRHESSVPEARPRTAFNNLPGREETGYKNAVPTDSYEQQLPATLLVPRNAAADSQQLSVADSVAELQQTHAPAMTLAEPPVASNTADDQAAEPAVEHTPAPPAAGAATGSEVFAVDPALVKCWKQWSGLVEALRHGQPVDVAEADYGDLQRALLDSCRSHLHRAGEAEQVLFERMEGIVEPWLNWQALACMDHENLSSLSERCRQIDRVLGVERRSYVSLALTLAALVFAAGLGWFLMQAPSQRWADLSSPASWLRFVETNPIASMSGLLVLVVLISISCLGRVFR